MSSSETRNISQVIVSAGLPLLIAGMVLSAGLALYMTAGTLMRKLGPEGGAVCHFGLRLDLSLGLFR